MTHRKQLRLKDPSKKHCTKCDAIKDRASFNRGSTSNDGLHCWCKDCARANAREWYHSHKNQAAATKRRYATTTAAKASHRSSVLRSRYGLSIDDYNAKLLAQGGRCASCGTTEPGGSGSFHVDHDHRCCPGRRSCGKCVRDLLCRALQPYRRHYREGPHWTVGLYEKVGHMTARILYWDFESAPALGWVWRKWETNVLSFEADWYVLSVAWHWEGDKGYNVASLPTSLCLRENPEDDQGLVRLAHDLFDKADIVIAHNGIAFDTRKIQARMMFHGLNPPSPYSEVDTLKIARKHFSFTSNRLDDLCQPLGIGRKLATGGFDTWLGCMRGDPTAWAKMTRYNKHDVKLLVALYMKLLPWTTVHPNLATISGDLACARSAAATRA